MRRFVRSTIILLLALSLTACASHEEVGERLPVGDEQMVSSNDTTTPSYQVADSGGVSGNEISPDVSENEDQPSGTAVVKPEPSALPDPFNGVGGGSVAPETSTEPAGCINVKTCGAVGDGVTDDYTAVSGAVALAGSTGAVLYFPAGTYYLSQRLVLNQSITILGESMDSVKIIFKDDAPYSPNEQYNQRGMITFVADSLNAKGVTFCYYAEAYSGYTKEKDGSGGSEGVLFSVLKGSAISFHNCRFLVEGKNNPSVTCLWIKSEVYNITNIRISSCDIRNNSAATVGGGVWISAHDSSDTFIDTVEVCDNTFFKAGNDEIFATWGYHISNVKVHNNSFNFNNYGTQNDVLISFGSPKEGRQESLRNIKFYGNNISETGAFARVIAIQTLTADSDVEISDNRVMCYPSATSKVSIFRVKDPGSAVIKNNSIGVDGGDSVEYLTYSSGTVRFSGNFFKTRNTGSTALIRTSHSEFYPGVDIRFDKDSYDLGAAVTSSGKDTIQISAGGNVVFESCSIDTSAGVVHETVVNLIYSGDGGYSYPSGSLAFTNCYFDTVMFFGFSASSNTSVDLSGSYINGISIVAGGSVAGPDTLNMSGTQYNLLQYNGTAVTPDTMAEYFKVVS